MTLTEDFVRVESQKPCAYCGKEPSNTMRPPKYNGAFVYNGFDRVDNSRGYDQNNVVTCCRRCNMMRNNMGQTEFLEHVNQIFTHQRTLCGH